MSFFRNIRSSITRSKSTSRDTSPVRNSRPGSVISNATGRRDSIDSRADSILNRSDTFILNSDQEDKSHSNTSTLEKKSKKSKVLSKFSTFTKRKKTPTPEPVSLEHHPSDNATNTYYKWKTEGSSNMDYDSLTDPFNFLYEQHSSLTKSLQNNAVEPTMQRSNSTHSNSSSNSTFDSSTYRKSKMPLQLKEQLEQLKTQTSTDLDETEEHESDKYKTVTLNSFRKSFRDKYLQQQKEAPYNPAWFVKVETPAATTVKQQETDKLKTRRESKENRPDLFVYENENYRPESRSPVRDRKTQHNSRATTRSPVKRNETFRVERSSEPLPAATPSIRIEIRNSITPHMPGRIVPVGVAKPMPSQYNAAHYQHQHQQQQQQHRNQTTTTTTANLSSNKYAAQPKTWLKPHAVSPSRHTNTNTNTNNRAGRYQTLVQIRNDAHIKPLSKSTAAQATRGATRIQLGAATPTTTKFYTSNNNNNTTRYMPQTSTTTLGNYETSTLQQSHAATPAAHRPKHTTYFGDAQLQQPMGNSTRYSGNSAFGAAKNALQHTQPQSQHLNAQLQARSVATNRAAGSYLRHYLPVQQQRVVVPVQRRSRSPIKMPWR